MLPFHAPSFNGIDPLVRSPSPERPLPFRHLAQKEEQYILTVAGLDAGIVQRIVQGLYQSVERWTKVHRSPVPIEAIRLCIASQHVFFNNGERAGPVISIQLQRPCPRAVVCLLGRCLLRPPLCAWATLEVLGTLLCRQRRGPTPDVVGPWLTVLPYPLLLHWDTSASIWARRAGI